MRKDSFTEAAETHGWERGIEGSYKVFVEPLCFFDLEAYSRHFREVTFGEIHYKSDAEVVQP